MSDPRILKLIATRRDAIREWLAECAPFATEEQKQLDNGSSEQAYWHYGYQAALTDLLNLAGEDKHPCGSGGRLN